MLCAVVPQVCCVLSCAAHLLFCGRGRCAVTGGRVHTQATPHPKGSDSLCSVRSNLSGRGTRDPGLHCRACVKHPRAGCMRYCRTLMARVRTYRFTETRHSSLALGGNVDSKAKVQICAVLPRVPRFITVLPLPLSLDHKSTALPGLSVVLKAGIAGLTHFHVFSTGIAGPLPPREKKKDHVPHVVSWSTPSLPTCHSYTHFCLLVRYCRHKTDPPGYQADTHTQQEDQGSTIVHSDQTRSPCCTFPWHVGNWARR